MVTEITQPKTNNGRKAECEEEEEEYDFTPSGIHDSKGEDLFPSTRIRVRIGEVEFEVESQCLTPKELLGYFMTVVKLCGEIVDNPQLFKKKKAKDTGGMYL